MSGLWSVTCDRTGFPLVSLRDWDFYIALFPVSKHQFERFLADDQAWGLEKGRKYTDKLYREHLAGNPRVSWREWGQAPWALFLTGVGPREAQTFLKYLGPHFELPTQEQWLLLHEEALGLRLIREQLSAEVLPEKGFAAPVRKWIKKLPIPITEEGVLEMVRTGAEVMGIGHPWEAFEPNLWDPREVRTIPHDRPYYFQGFRPALQKKTEGSDAWA